MADRTSPFTVRVDAELRDRFRELCDEAGVPMNKALGRLMREAMEDPFPEGIPKGGIRPEPDPETVIAKLVSPLAREMRAGLLSTNAYNTAEEDSFFVSTMPGDAGASAMRVCDPDPARPGRGVSVPFKGSFRISFQRGRGKAFLAAEAESPDIPDAYYARIGGRRLYAVAEGGGPAGPASMPEMLEALSALLSAFRAAAFRTRREGLSETVRGFGEEPGPGLSGSCSFEYRKGKKTVRMTAVPFREGGTEGVRCAERVSGGKTGPKTREVPEEVFWKRFRKRGLLKGTSAQAG